LSVVAAEKPDGGAIAKLRFAALAAELPIKPETQAELIGDGERNSFALSAVA
jgi:hypothetical protein